MLECRAVSLTAGALGLSTVSLDLKRVYETPFPDRAGRLPLGQASKREEAGLRVSVTGYPQNGADEYQ